MTTPVFLRVWRDTTTRGEGERLDPDAGPMKLGEDAEPVIRIEGLLQQDLERLDASSSVGELVRLESGRSLYRWRLFPGENRVNFGDVAYGAARLEFGVGNRALGRFRFEIGPSRYSAEMWGRIVEDVRRVCAALLTEWGRVRSPLAGANRRRLGGPETYSPVQAFAEIERQWERVRAAVHRIARNPAREFRVPPPQRTFGESGPGLTADIPENWAVRQTLERLERLLAGYARLVSTELAEETHRADILRTRLPKPNRPLVPDEIIARLELLARTRGLLEERAREAGALARLVPGRPPAHRGSTTFAIVAQRMRRRHRYGEVLGLWGPIGCEDIVTDVSHAVSLLAARRASFVYESWVTLTLWECLHELGFAADQASVSALVRWDLFEPAIRREQPLTFHSPAGEVVRLVYTPQAHAAWRDDKPAKRLSDREWDRFRASRHPERVGELVSRFGPQTPDFLVAFEGPRGSSFSFGDAIFSRSEHKVGRKKAWTVDGYADIVRIGRGGVVEYAARPPFIAFCGTMSDLDAILRCAQGTPFDVEFWPIHPETVTGPDRVNVGGRIERWLERLREEAVSRAAGGSGENG